MSTETWAGQADGWPAPWRLVAQRHDIAVHAEELRKLVDAGEDDRQLFRFGVLQMIDWYKSIRKYEGVDVAAAIFDNEPESTGHAGLDAAFAALADWYADVDGWTPKPWVAARVLPEPWYPYNEPYLIELAQQSCPPAFRRHNVWLSDRGLQRA